MATKTTTALPPEDDTAEEIVGILTAISVVSKRLAKKLRLEQAAEHEGGGKPDEQDE